MLSFVHFAATSGFSVKFMMRSKRRFAGLGGQLKICGDERLASQELVCRFGALVEHCESLAGTKSVCGDDDRFSLKDSRWGAERALDAFGRNSAQLSTKLSFPLML